MQGEKSGESQGILLCEIYFQHPNIENFLGEHAPRSPSTVLDTYRNLIVVWKNHEKAREFHPFWRLDTLLIVGLIIYCFMLKNCEDSMIKVSKWETNLQFIIWLKR